MQHLQKLATQIQPMRAQIRVPGHHNRLQQFLKLVARAACHLAICQCRDQILNISAIERWQVIRQGDRRRGLRRLTESRSKTLIGATITVKVSPIRTNGSTASASLVGQRPRKRAFQVTGKVMTG